MNLLILQGIEKLDPLPSALLKNQDVLFSLDNDHFEDISQSSVVEDLKAILHDCWTTCREDLAEYTASLMDGQHPYSPKFEELGSLFGLPLWQLTGLGKRDPEVHKDYFYNFTRLYFIKQLLKKGHRVSIACTDTRFYGAAKDNFPNVKIAIRKRKDVSNLRSVKLLRQFIGTLGVLILTKFFLKKKTNINNSDPRNVFFLSFHPISWVLSPNQKPMDRHYSTSTFREGAFGMRSCFLIYPWPNFKKIASFNSYIQELNATLGDLARPYSVLSYWTAKELFSSLFILGKALLYLRRVPSHGFQVSGLKLEKIFRPWISDYIYNGETLRIIIQNYALLHELEVQKRKNQPNIIVTYSQLFPESRLLAASLSKHWKLLTVQHAVEYKNKFSNYFKAPELKRLNLPSCYFAQGEGYAKILASYYPEERIHTIGSLKYDVYFERMQNLSSIEKSPMKKLLIAPSLEDLDIILPFFQNAKIPSNWKVLMKPHPAMPSSRWSEAFKGMNVPIEITNTPIWDLMAEVDLVAFNYSSVGLEAAFWNVPSIRLSSKKVFEIFDPDPSIPCFYAAHELSDYLTKDLPSSTTETIRFYFHKFDGLCYQRFWTYIQKEMKDS